MAGRDEVIRAVVKISARTHPELYDELKGVDERGRAERIRTLATSEARRFQAGYVEPVTPAQSRPAEAQDSAAASEKGREPEAKPDPHKEVRRGMLAGIKNQF